MFEFVVKLKQATRLVLLVRYVYCVWAWLLLTSVTHTYMCPLLCVNEQYWSHFTNMHWIQPQIHNALTSVEAWEAGTFVYVLLTVHAGKPWTAGTEVTVANVVTGGCVQAGGAGALVDVDRALGTYNSRGTWFKCWSLILWRQKFLGNSSEKKDQLKCFPMGVWNVCSKCCVIREV